MKKISFYSIILFTLWGNIVLGQKFTASLDKTQVENGDVVRLSYRLEGGEGTGFSPPAMPGFRVLAGPETSTEIRNFNGIVTRSMGIDYILQVMGKGKLKIGSAHINCQGRALISNAVTIESRNSGTNISKSLEPGEGFFLKAIANKTNAWQGEAVAVTYKLYFAHNVTMNVPTVVKMPKFTGFWSEDAKTNQQGVTAQELVNGKQYTTYIIRKLLLFPQKTGSLLVDPLEIECSGQMLVSKEKDAFDPFGDFYNPTTIPFHKKVMSAPVTISVTPLPENKPASFTGMVGRAAIAASIDRDDVKANEPVILTLTMGGEGNLVLQQPLKPTLPEGIEAYEPKTIDKLERSGDNITGTRTFEYTLMPHKKGKYEIPALKFSYFDPVKKNYIETETIPLALNVEEGAPRAETNDETTPQKQKSLSTSSIIIISTAALALLLLFAVRIVRKKANPYTNEPGRDESYTAYMEEAKNLVNSDPHNEFYSTMLNALYRYMSEILAIPFSDISHDKIQTGLRQKGVSETYIASYLALIDECEMINYAGGGNMGNKDRLYARSVDMINSIEKSVI